MEINIKKQAGKWKVEFTHGVQTFTLDYEGNKKECLWMAERLDDCFKLFVNDSLNEFIQPILKQAKCPHNNVGKHDYDNIIECLDCGTEFNS